VLLVVDAADEAARAFYGRHGFLAVASSRLVARITGLEAALDR
jgi:hypothetical protein